MNYKDSMILKACKMALENNWSSVEMSKKLDISRSTAYRWCTDYIKYIDIELYQKLKTQFANRRKR